MIRFLVSIPIFFAVFLTPFGVAAQFEEEPFTKAALSFLPRKSLNPALLGVNSFVNDPRFGSISSQLREVKNVLHLRHVRLLFAWNDQVQPSASSQPFFGFYDDIARNLPAGVHAVVVVTGIPTWMRDSDNWIEGNPRKTFVELWLRPLMSRYSRNRKIKAWQIWNEPNMLSNNDNSILQFADVPENYVEMLAFAYALNQQVSPSKKIVSAASTAINQNYPQSLNYNKSLKNAGAENFLDFWGVHIYGTHLENFFRPSGVSGYLQGLQKPIWITESGEKGTNKQRDYAQRMWPFLFDLIPGIKRLYIYQFTDDSAAAQSYGLRTLTAGSLYSDLYLYLKGLVKKRRR